MIAMPMPAKQLPSCIFTMVHRGPNIVDFWHRIVRRGAVRSRLAYSRNFGCHLYDSCLGLAIELDWASFTCDGCPVFYVAVCDPIAFPPSVEPTPRWTLREVERSMQALKPKLAKTAHESCEEVDCAW